MFFFSFSSFFLQTVTCVFLTYERIYLKVRTPKYIWNSVVSISRLISFSHFMFIFFFCWYRYYYCLTNFFLFGCLFVYLAPRTNKHETETTKVLKKQENYNNNNKEKTGGGIKITHLYPNFNTVNLTGCKIKLHEEYLPEQPQNNTNRSNCFIFLFENKVLWIIKDIIFA